MFFRTTLVLAFSGQFLLSLQENTKFIKIYTKFRIKQTNVLPSKCTSVLLRSKLIQQNSLRFVKKFLKKVRALRANKSKLTFRSAFIVNLFALESKK